MQVQGRRAAVAYASARNGGQAGIEHDAQGRRHIRALGQAHRELRVVGQHGAAGGQKGAAARAPVLHVHARGFRSDPLRFAAGQRRAPVQAHAEFDPQPGPPALDTREETAVELARLGLHQSGFDRDAGLAQFRQSGAVHGVEGIACRRHHPRHAGSDQRIGTRRRTALVRAGFQRHIGGRSPRPLAGCLQSHRFGMRFAGAQMESLADHIALRRQNATDHRIGTRRVEAAFGQAQGTRHEDVVVGAELAHAARLRGSIAITSTGVPSSSARRNSRQPSRR